MRVMLTQNLERVSRLTQALRRRIGNAGGKPGPGRIRQKRGIEQVARGQVIGKQDLDTVEPGILGVLPNRKAPSSSSVIRKSGHHGAGQA